MLAPTLEKFTIPPHLAGRLKASPRWAAWACCDSTAGFIDLGFTGHITLELSNVANLPISLWPGMKVGQLALFRMTPGGGAVRSGALG